MKQTSWRQYDLDLLGVGLLLTVVVGGYALLLHRPLTDWLRHDVVKTHCDEITRDICALQTRYARTSRKVNDQKRQLNTAKAVLPKPDGADGLLSKLNEIASECGVVVGRWQPMGTEKKAGYQVTKFLVEGQAPFPRLCRWLAMTEGTVPYLDMTNFSIRPANQKAQTCRFECWMRFFTSEATSGQLVVAKQ